MKISLPQSVQPQYVINRVQNPILASKIAPLKFDSCAFTGKTTQSSSVDAFDESKKILKKIKYFSVSDYEKLSRDDIKQLRKTSKTNFLSRDLEQIPWAYNVMKKNLDRLYPNGYVFVSIGRSPACFAKMLQDHGKDVKFCPSISMQGHRFSMPDGYVKSYAEYLNSIGITDEAIRKSEKPFVFVDYTYNGNTLKHFEEMLKSEGIGISKSPKIHFVSLNNELLEMISCKGKEDFFAPQTQMDEFVTRYFLFAGIKKYSPVPHLDNNYKRWDVKTLINSHKESFESKLFSFHIIDSIKSKSGFSGRPSFLERVIKPIFSKLARVF